MALLPMLLAAAVLCLHCTSIVEGVIPACADTPGVSGRLRCVNWQVNATGDCTTTFTSSSFVPSVEGATYIYSPGFVGGSTYVNNAACTWLVPKTDECSSLQFILVVKDLAHNEQNGQNCANNDHLDVDNGQQLYCDAEGRNNCPFNNCPSVAVTTDASNLEITFRTDESNFRGGVFGVVFEVPNGNCATRRKRTAHKAYGKVELPHYCPQHQRYRRTYQHHYYTPTPYKPTPYKPPPCECFGNCTAEGVDNQRVIAQKIINDNTGKKALKYVNSESDFLRGVARLAWQNLYTFNMTVPPYEVINDASCIMPPTQTFEVPYFTAAPRYNPWTRPTHKPNPWTQPTHSTYPRTPSTRSPQHWDPHTTRRPYYHTTASRPKYVPQPKSWSPW